MDSRYQIDEKEKLTLKVKLGQVFTPGAPVDKYKLFAGRRQQVDEVINTINQRGQHIIIYGERGVGKTSLANVIHEILSGAGLKSLNAGAVNCDGSDNFDKLWRKIFREFTVSLKVQPAGFNTNIQNIEKSYENFLPDKELEPDDVRYLLMKFENHIIIILDELDRIQDRNTTTLLADTIKTLSDHSMNVTLLLVGVADSVEDLIAEHQSIERALVQVQMPRMSKNELSEIIDRGLAEIKLDIENEVKIRIAKLSQGLPHYTHLLALHAGQNAIDSNRKIITNDDFRPAIERAVQKAQQTIKNIYYRAISSSRKDTLYAQVLLACALADKNELGYFSAVDIREILSRIMKRPYDIPAYSRHLNEFCKEERGPILRKMGTRRRFKFRFLNPMMQPFVLMSAYTQGLINFDEETL